MATRGPPVRVRRGFERFKSVLASAVFEWLLIVLIFFDAILSFLITKFADFCELQTPCLLCSRLDHILGGRRPGFYSGLICVAHKLEISSLAYCHIHKNLANVHGMCEGCQVSCAAEKKSNSETHRSLVGKLGKDLGCCTNEDDWLQSEFHGEEDLLKDPLFQDPLLASVTQCSCCNEPLSKKSYNHKLLQTKPIGDEVTELEVPSTHLMGNSCLNRKYGLKRRREKSSGSPVISHRGNHGFDPLSHIGYTEVKVTSDSDSEVPLSDDDDGRAGRAGRAIVRETDDIKEEFSSRGVKPDSCIVHPDILPKKILFDDLVEKLIDQAPMPETSLLVPHEQLHASELHDVSSVAYSVSIGHGLEELNWHQVEERGNSSAFSADKVGEAPVDLSEEKLNVVEMGQMADIKDAPIAECGEVVKLDRELASTELALKANRISNDPGHSMPSFMDLNDAYKLAVGSKGNQTSGTFTELLIGKDSTKVQEDLKLLMSQLSAARGFELSWTDLSPRLHGHGDDFKTSDPSGTFGLQMLHKRLSIERNESGFESLDGSIVSEIEGESALDRLKRQFELDRKSMSALYKELEEERSASAISANQAMAMITRLQEEKAAMQMEALQYQRMMEEQAEYDQEALQKSNELLAQREKEIQDLEAEIKTYRKRFQNESMEEKVPVPMSDLNGGEMREEWNKTGMIPNPLLDFEDEKLYISECLQKLEKKLQLFSNNGVYVDMSEINEYKDVLPYKIYEDSYNHNQGQDQTPLENLITGNGGYSGEEALDMKDSSVLGGGLHDKARCIPSIGDTKFITKENHNEKLIAIGNEVSQLNGRLEVLEADRNFLEHTINSLKSGNEGVSFIQEIASHLRELRRIGLRREQAVA